MAILKKINDEIMINAQSLLADLYHAAAMETDSDIRAAVVDIADSIRGVVDRARVELDKPTCR